MPTAVDAKNAAAFIAHYLAHPRDDDGIDCILAQLGENATPFLEGLIGAYLMLVDLHCDPLVRVGLVKLLGFHAAHGPRPYRDAALIVFAYVQSCHDGDPHAFNAALCEGDPPPHPLPVIHAISDMFGHAMPAKRRDEIRAALQEWAARLDGLATDDDGEAQ
jgi:hypothetical protein